MPQNAVFACLRIRLLLKLLRFYPAKQFFKRRFRNRSLSPQSNAWSRSRCTFALLQQSRKRKRADRNLVRPWRTSFHFLELFGGIMQASCRKSRLAALVVFFHSL
jgi:hypothetical protein